MTLIGDAPRPWVIGFDLTDDEASALAPFCGRLVRKSSQDNEEFWAEEFDVAVSFGGGLLAHNAVPYRVTFAEEPSDAALNAIFAGSVGVDSSTLPVTTPWIRRVPAQRVRITDHARDKNLHSLVLDSCVPVPGTQYVAFREPVHPPRKVYPLLVEELDHGQTLAALIEEEGDSFAAEPMSSLIWLPAGARTHLSAWFGAAIALWRVQAPERFPVNADWEAEMRWSSPAEIAARDLLTVFEDEEGQRLARAETARQGLRAELEQATQGGAEARAILTGDGDELVEAVGRALSRLGFEVVNADALPENRSAKKEDLQVRLGSWVALAEVKGYTRGAKSNDLLQVLKAAMTFAVRTSREPDALWYIVNAHRRTDPAVRPIPLESDPDHVSSIENGCVIDTRELFRLWQAVELGLISKEDGRTQLQSAHGLYRFTLS